jgi:intracellular septation protein
MKLLTDLFPVLLFFVVYKLSDIYAATMAAMLAASLQAGWLWLRHRRLEPMQMAVVGLIVGLGALTLIFNDPAFIKWKTTLVNWGFAAALIGGELFGGKSILERMLGEKMSLPRQVWRNMTLSWIGFFIGVGALNLFVAYRYELDVWVNFKLYGVLGLTLAFTILQGLLLSRHLSPEATINKGD